MKANRFIKCTPHLPVKNLKSTIQYYVNTLGFSGEWTYGQIDGGVSRNDLFMLFEENTDFAEKLNASPHRLPLVWFVDNIDEIYREYEQKNIKLADPLKNQSYGLREFAFIDINGYYIRIAESSNVASE
jgi:uncharacterized glyoxalase superfamily protein PhnB